MAAPVLVAVRVLRAGKDALRRWQSLPEEHRAETQERAVKVGTLVQELAILTAASARKANPLPPGPSGSPNDHRGTREVVSDLRDAISHLAIGVAGNGTLATVPKTRKGRITAKAAGAAARRIGTRRGDASTVQTLPSSSASATLDDQTAVGLAEPDPPAREVRPGEGTEPVAELTEDTLRTADAAGDALAARQLGEVLEERGGIDAAEAAYRRAEDRGDVRAIVLLGFLLEDHRKDVVGAEDAYRRADARGDLNGAGNLGRLLRDLGKLSEAEAAFKRCANRGSVQAIGDVAGLMLRREDATQAEMSQLTDIICYAQDKFFLKKDLDAAAAVVCIDTIGERAPAAFAAGTARADERGSAAGAWHVAWALKSEGRLQEAAAAFRRSLDRGYAEASFYLAGVHQDIGDLVAAEAVAREGDEAGVGRASFMLGWLLERRGDTDGALEAYRRADAAGDPHGSFNLGVALTKRGELEAAQVALERAVEGDVEEARDALTLVKRQLDPSSPDPASGRADESLWARGVRLERAGDVSGSLKAYREAQRAGEEPHEPRAILRSAELLESQDDPRAEVTFLRLANESDPSIRAQAWRGIAKYRFERGQIDHGLEALQVVIDTADPDEVPRALRNMGVYREDLGDIDGARAAYGAAIDHDHPYYSDGARVNLAQILNQEGDHAGAARLFHEVIRSGHPSEAPRARVLLGLMLEDEGRQTEALEWWESAVTSDEEEWSQRGAQNAARVYYDREDVQRAAPLLRIAGKLDSPQEAATAHFVLSMCETQLGNRDAAIEALERTAELATGDLQATAQERLRNMR